MSENFWTWTNILNAVVLVAACLLGLYAVWRVSRARRPPAPRVKIERDDVRPVERLSGPAKTMQAENINRFVALLKENGKPDA